MIKRFFAALDEHLEEYLIAFLLIALTVVMLMQVALRYVFNSSLSWPEEFCRYCFVYMAFLSIGYCIKRKSMLKLDIVVNALPKTLSKIISVLVQLICLAFYIYMLKSSFSLVASIKKTARTSPAMQIPFYFVYLSTVIGFALAVIRSVQNLVLEFLPMKADKEADAK